MEMETYERTELTVTVFDSEDIITTSDVNYTLQEYEYII